MKKLLFVVNTTSFFLSHRLPIALAAKDAGYEVHIATGTPDLQAIPALAPFGLPHHFVPISRSGKNLISEVSGFWALYKLMKQLKPDLVHLVTIKPVLYGGIAARFAKIPGTVAAISGLGLVFCDNSIKNRFLRFITSQLYRLALSQGHLRVIFQNQHDLKKLSAVCKLADEHVSLIPGSGVQLNDYPYKPEPEGQPVVTFAARLIKEKGPYVFERAARMLRERGVKARFLILGSVDPGNPNSVNEKDITAWSAEGIVEVLGQADNVASFFIKSHIICLPSYYGEGLPKVLIEAAACGRAVVTTDHPGCKDAIIPGVTGLLVSKRNAYELAEALERLILNPALRQKMGRAGRTLAEQRFGIDKVIDAHMQAFDELLNKASGKVLSLND